MVLRVKIEDFARVAEQLAGGKLVAVSGKDGQSRATAVNPAGTICIIGDAPEPVADLERRLVAQGFDVYDGDWTIPGLEDGAAGRDVFVAAVAYKSREEMPGLWVDAFDYEPNQGEVLKALFDEFSESGTIEGVNFEEFVRSANPNVVVLGPDDANRFVQQKRAPESD
jgi:hypothetical protein